MVRPFLGLQRNTEAELRCFTDYRGSLNAVKITENVMFPVPMNNYFHHQKYMHTYRKTSAYSTEYCLLTKAMQICKTNYTMYSLRNICKNNYTMYSLRKICKTNCTMYSLCRIQKVEL
jgi:hypothetical protein